MLASAICAGHSYSGCWSYGGVGPRQLEPVLQADRLVVPWLDTCLSIHGLSLLARCDGPLYSLHVMHQDH